MFRFRWSVIKFCEKQITALESCRGREKVMGNRRQLCQPSFPRLENENIPVTDVQNEEGKASKWSSNLTDFQSAQTWSRVYGCPTCSMRFSGWHECLKHLKSNSHVRKGAYATKEQLRLLLQLPDRDADVPPSVIALLRNPEAAQRAQGQLPAPQPPRTRWMYQCPVCLFACTKWPSMWAHVGRTGHITKESYRDAHQLRLLLRKEKPPGSLARAFDPAFRWEETGGPVLADGSRARIVLRAGTLRLAATPPGPPPLAYGPNPIPDPSPIVTAEGAAPAAAWTAAMQAALDEALIEYPAAVHWKDRLGLVAARVGVPRAALEARAHGPLQSRPVLVVPEHNAEPRAVCALPWFRPRQQSGATDWAVCASVVSTRTPPPRRQRRQGRPQSRRRRLPPGAGPAKLPRLHRLHEAVPR